jgi:gliding motility-associated-like protein
VLRWTISLSGCSSTIDDVTIILNAFPSGSGNIIGLGSLCPNISGDYVVSGITNATSYHWDVPRGLEIVSQSGTTSTVKAVGDAGLKTITVEGVNDCGTGGSAKINVTVLTPPDISLDIPSEAFIDDAVDFSYSSSSAIASQTWAFGEGGTSSEASPSYVYSSSGDFTISLDVIDDNGCVNSATKGLVVHPEAELSSFSIKNVVTANGDEKNRYLYIERIERFPESEVIVLDRLGVEVFRRKSYTNDWDLRKGEDFLPAGNYVCVVKSNGKVYSRSVTVIKGK